MRTAQHVQAPGIRMTVTGIRMTITGICMTATGIWQPDRSLNTGAAPLQVKPALAVLAGPGSRGMSV
jgi:hypothetical protein